MTTVFDAAGEAAVDGFVSIVGAGPGDPGLLTVTASERLETADLVLSDRLVGEGVLTAIPDETTVEHVGKGPDGGGTAQSTINERMVESAEGGATVVRLKSGDPCVFGRGGEEAEYLAAHSIPFELVPGVTSGVAAPAAAGIPLTHREHASSVTVVTGHEDPTKPESALDWSALGASVTAGGTLVILMGVRQLAGNIDQLRATGVPPETPAAMIERATLADERTVHGTLATIVDRARSADIAPPATTVVGDVIEVGHAVERWLHSGDDVPAVNRSVTGDETPDPTP